VKPPLKICVVTGTRADYGLLHWVMKGIEAASELELQVIATCMHLSPEFGLTVDQIIADGFRIDERIEMLLSGDTPSAVAKSMGLATIGFADAFVRLQPDMIMLLGDRFELLAAAQAALVARLPIAHIAGGDTSEGAYDEAIRHSITKMSHLHFVTNSDAHRRVRQLGENPRNIHCVGSPGLDYVRRVTLLDRPGLETALGFRLRERNILVTFHPTTLETQPAEVQFAELLEALAGTGDDVGLIFTKPNADNEGRGLIAMVDAFVSQLQGRAVAHTSLGQLRYLSTMAHVDMVVGNSSSGLYEAPSFKKPTVNVGDRQKGRMRADSVIDCPVEREAIAAAIERAWHKDCSAAVNPYGDGHSAERIVEVLRAVENPKSLLMKHFFEEPSS
jgi:UDP-hydrolysing UDP-N-acetyl-D-glucosamine 2-epimerase